MADGSLTNIGEIARINAANKIYWRGKPIEDYSKEELIEIIKFQMQQYASAGETIHNLSNLIKLEMKR